MKNYDRVSLAIVLASDFNHSTERAINETSAHLISLGAKVSLFIPNIPHFHSYWFNLNLIFRLDPKLFYTKERYRKIGYFLIKTYLYFKKKHNHKIVFHLKPIYYTAHQTLDLSMFDNVISHNAYLLPFLKTKTPPLLTINADYLHQSNVSMNPAWWSYCMTVVYSSNASLFTNSEELKRKYILLGLHIRGVIPDGPSYKNVIFTENRDRNLLLIYGHDSPDKGFNCFNEETINFLENLNDGKISIIGSNCIKLRSNKFNNYGALPYLEYLSIFKQYKIFLYLSRSDGFESPPMDALLSGCIVISSKTPAALHYSQFTNRILLLENLSKIEIENTIATAISYYTAMTSSEFKALKRHAKNHSAEQGAKNYLNYIKYSRL